MASYILFSPSGEITAQLQTVNLGSDLAARPGEAALYGIADSTTHYVDMPTLLLTPKADAPIVADKTTVVADEVDAVTITGIPEGSTITVGDDPPQPTPADGGVSITFDAPGSYPVRIATPVQYLDWEMIIDAT